ncbi:MAG: hypothetical protein C7M88_05715 [Candidatus Arcticimaribacter sp.]|nr:MAG: hypothetical protein C7M88_05715 [Candidatus Arcticimaribacter sp.]PTM02431.1 MAG: hypothetical protein DA394_00670 [Candidatus Arcticimaribacter sp.]
MPFIEEEKLAKLYKEIDDERNASSYFRTLYQSTKKKIAYVNVYAVGFYLLLPTVIVLGILFLSDAPPIDQSQEQPLIEATDATVNIQEEHDVLDIKSLMQDTRIFSVQIAASRDESWLLFSENFINFRVHEVGELNAYSIGSFATEDEANVFRDKIIDMGIKDAWVVAYEDGERIILHK